MIQRNARPKTDPSYRLTIEDVEADILEAFKEASTRKRYTANEAEFEFFKSWNVRILARKIFEQTYETSGGIAFLSLNPTTREIFGASFVDRVVHHYLFDKMYDFVDARLDPDSYSCRQGKGTDYGIKRLQRYMNLVSKNGKVDTVVVKLDLSGHFMNLSRRKLYDMIIVWLKRLYPEGMVNERKKRSDEYYLLKYLWGKIIMDEPIVSAHVRGTREFWSQLRGSKSLYMQRSGVGIVIGNLSSQLLSNMYLDKLDRFVRFQLGYRNYGRYVDDFFVVIPRSELARFRNDLPRIKKYLLSLGAILNETKTRVYDVRQGVPFLGKVIYLTHIQMGRRTKRNMFYAVLNRKRADVVEDALRNGATRKMNWNEISNAYKRIEKAKSGLTSYKGFLMHCAGKEMMKTMLKKADCKPLEVIIK